MINSITFNLNNSTKEKIKSFYGKDKYNVAIITTLFHKEIMDVMIENTKSTLDELIINQITNYRVFGTYEIPNMLSRLISKRIYTHIVLCGALIKGETDHHRILGDSVISSILNKSMDLQEGIGLAIMVTNSLEQAVERAKSVSIHATVASLIQYMNGIQI